MADKNKNYLKRAFNRKAANFSKADFLHAIVRDELLERLSMFRLKPLQSIVLGGGGGELAEALRRQYPGTRCLSIDSSEAMSELAQRHGEALCADMLELPLADNSVDLIVSNLTLQYGANPLGSLQSVLNEINRVLKPGGLLLTAFCSNGSFAELRESCARDNYEHFDTLPDLHIAGDEMLKAGLRDPVLDTEPLTITYSSFDKLINELRAVSATRQISRRRKGLGGKTYWQQTRLNYDTQRNVDDKLPVTIELVYAHARGGEAPKLAEPAEYSVPLSRLLGRGPRKMTTDEPADDD
jgi:malonyl-CoA O-methyltransferase